MYHTFLKGLQAFFTIFDIAFNILLNYKKLKYDFELRVCPFYASLYFLYYSIGK